MPGYQFDGFVQATLVTNSKKLTGQKHRCSDNFHFHSLKQGVKIRWNIEGGENVNITFNVSEDIKGGTDHLIYSSIKDGDSNIMPKGDSIYISDVKQNNKEIDKNYPIKITVTVID